MLQKTTCCSLLIVTLMCGCASVGAQQEDPAVLAERATTAIAETGGELAKLKAFDAEVGLPSGLTKEQADQLGTELWDIYKAGITMAASKQSETLGELPPSMAELIEQAGNGRVQIAARMMPLREFEMPFVLIRKEPSGVPDAGRPMFICTHGGGQRANAAGPHAWASNTREWQTQTRFALRLYEPEGLYFVPRMADDRKGRWRHAHHHDQFELAIRHGILFWGVDPNRVYKLGISQGGFGSAILGMFMPDLFAGINPMAGGVGLGNPPENLRNVATFHSVGEKDTRFNRAGNAIATHERLEELRKKDPGGYVNQLDVQPGRGHGIDYRPGAPWIAKHNRDPYPDVVVWTSKEVDGRRRDSMYWLGLEGDDLKGTIALTGRIDLEANRVDVTAYQLALAKAQGDPTQIGEQASEPKPLKGAIVNVMLNDKLLDLDQPVTITCNGKVVFQDKVRRDGDTLLQTLVRRGDPNYVFPVRIPIVME
ncbi:MAG: hypothetical protein AAGB26_16620 [Planctomycetota bacterium]